MRRPATGGAWQPRRRWLLAGALLAVTANGCASTAPYVWARELPVPPATGEPTIGPRDTLLIEVRNQRELSGTFVVGDDGLYLHPTVGSVRAAGSTPAQLAALLKRRLQGMLVEVQVGVWLTKAAPVRVHVVGEVRTPGSYELGRDHGLSAALAAGGWLTEYADKDKIFVLRSSGESPRVRFTISEISGGLPHSSRFQLRDGDTVVVE
jgi:polysaccharide biosynthesis/export protein